MKTYTFTKEQLILFVGRCLEASFAILKYPEEISDTELKQIDEDILDRINALDTIKSWK
jgi:hypothetical protein